MVRSRRRRRRYPKNWKFLAFACKERAHGFVRNAMKRINVKVSKRTGLCYKMRLHAAHVGSYSDQPRLKRYALLPRKTWCQTPQTWARIRLERLKHIRVLVAQLHNCNNDFGELTFVALPHVILPTLSTLLVRVKLPPLWVHHVKVPPTLGTPCKSATTFGYTLTNWWDYCHTMLSCHHYGYRCIVHYLVLKNIRLWPHLIQVFVLLFAS